jgi:putative ABC transport system permease protein
MRTFFMTLGTLIGVTALTVVVAYGRGTQEAVLENISRMFSGSTIMLSAGGGGMMGGPHSSGPTTTLTLEDLDAIAAAVPEVGLYDPVMMLGGRDVIFDGRSEQLVIVGHSESHGAVWNRDASRGAYISRADVESSARVAVVGETTARELFGGADPIGKQIRIGNAPFEVIGVLAPAGVDPHGLDKDNEIHVPITTMMRRLVNVDYIVAAKFLVTQSADLDAVVFDIEDVLRERHALGPDEPNDFHMITPVQVEEMVESSNRVFTLFLPLVAAISIIVGGIVVANLMLMSVNERRAEIGLRKAVGAKTRDIRTQFMLESASVTTLGGLLALGIGFVVLQVLGHVSSTMPGARVQSAGAQTAGQTVALGLPWEAAALGIGVAILVGLVAGVVPAKRAAELDPVQTLR